MKKLSLLAFAPCALMALISCNEQNAATAKKATDNGAAPNELSPPPSHQEHARLQEKWNLLAQELKIGNNQLDISPSEKDELRRKIPGETKHKNKAYKDLFDSFVSDKITAQLAQPSGWLGEKPEEVNTYLNKMTNEVIPRLVSTVYATRGAEIVAFRPASKITPHYRVKVYELDYRLQKNHAGEAEEGLRTALISFPDTGETRKPLPVLVFSHGDDMGLSYTGLSTHLEELQENNIVIAPSFPGEPICAGDIGKRHKDGRRSLSCAVAEEMISPARGVSIPWSTDVDELLGLYDSFTKVAMNHFQGNQHLQDPAFAKQFIRQQGDAATRLKTAIDAAGGLAYGRAFPVSALIGVSRGGLVASLALAKAGAAWFKLFNANAGAYVGYLAFDGGVDLAARLTPKHIRRHAELNNILGEAFGFMPPASFNGLITLAAPSSITIGRYRMILEHMVKGHGKLVLNPAIPCLDLLSGIFDAYRKDSGEDELRAQQVLADAAYEIYSRDLSFLGPLLMVALKKFNAPLSDSWPGTAPYFMVHHKADKIVPREQSKIAASLMTGFSSNKVMRQMTHSYHGLQIEHHELDTTSESTSFHLDWKFKRTQPEVGVIIQHWYRHLL